MGYVPKAIEPFDLEQLRTFITRYRDNSYIQKIIRDHAEQYPDKVIQLKANPISLTR